MPRVAKRSSDTPGLILQWMRGDLSNEGIEKRLNLFMWDDLLAGHTELGRTASDLWAEHGASLIPSSWNGERLHFPDPRFHRLAVPVLPEPLNSLVGKFGIPPGWWK